MSAPIIEVKNLAKHYRIGAAPGGSFDTLRDRVAGIFQRRPGKAADKHVDFWALHDVTFSVQPGEVLGIIGANGAGKSTLLKILSRITEPTRGEVVLRGRVASLLEVGTGFHPELTGRENIFLNGVVLGMKRREVLRRFDEIVAFAGVEKFLDTPVKRYSSGMYVRLAFAVAAHLDPEILIVDEVLAVGDSAFQEKCLGKMHEMAAGLGRTVLFVSHNMAAIESLTTRALYLEKGTGVFIGATGEAVKTYLGRAKPASACGDSLSDQPRPAWLGDRKIDLLAGELICNEDRRMRDRIMFRLRLMPRVNIEGLQLVTKVNTGDGRPLGTAFLNIMTPFPEGRPVTVEAEISDPGLAPGHYTLSFVLMTAGGNPADAVLNVMGFDFEPLEGPASGHLAWRSDWGNVCLSCGQQSLVIGE